VNVQFEAPEHTSGPTDLTGLVDLASVAVADLWSVDDDNVLTRVLRRVTAAAGEHNDRVVSAFNSAV